MARQMTNDEFVQSVLDGPLSAPVPPAPDRFGSPNALIQMVIETAFTEARAAMADIAQYPPATQLGMNKLHQYLLHDVYEKPEVTRPNPAGVWAKDHQAIVDAVAAGEVDRSLRGLSSKTMASRAVNEERGVPGGSDDQYFAVMAGHALATLMAARLVNPPELTQALMLDAICEKQGFPVHWERIPARDMHEANMAIWARNDRRPMQSLMAAAIAEQAPPPPAAALAPPTPQHRVDPGAPKLKL